MRKGNVMDFYVPAYNIIELSTILTSSILKAHNQQSRYQTKAFYLRKRKIVTCISSFIIFQFYNTYISTNHSKVFMNLEYQLHLESKVDHSIVFP